MNRTLGGPHLQIGPRGMQKLLALGMGESRFRQPWLDNLMTTIINQECQRTSSVSLFWNCCRNHVADIGGNPGQYSFLRAISR